MFILSLLLATSPQLCHQLRERIEGRSFATLQGSNIFNQAAVGRMTELQRGPRATTSAEEESRICSSSPFLLLVRSSINPYQDSSVFNREGVPEFECGEAAGIGEVLKQLLLHTSSCVIRMHVRYVHSGSYTSPQKDFWVLSIEETSGSARAEVADRFSSGFDS